MIVLVGVVALLAVAPALGFDTTGNYLGDVLNCTTGQQKIVGAWRYSSKTCGEVNEARYDEYDPGYVAQCGRWLGRRVGRIAASNMYQCLKTRDGRVRYREEVCCEAATTLNRCLSCADVLVPYDALQSNYISEVCDYNYTVQTCQPDQVCITSYSYNTTGIYVSKGCAAASPCSTLEQGNSQTCKNQYDAWPSCTYCCKDRFCNHLGTVPKPRRLVKLTSVCCYNGGTCLNAENKTCACPPGFSGPQCRQNPCSSRPCKNYGFCRTNSTSAPYYKCHCRPQFTGDNCELDADQCDVNMCQNNGTCYTHAYGDRCVCADGFVGAHCEIRTLTCDTERQYYRERSSYDVLFRGTWRYNCTLRQQFRTQHRLGTSLMHRCLTHMGGRYVDATSFGDVTNVPEEGAYTCEKGEEFAWTLAEACCPACFSSPCQNGGWCQSDRQNYVCKCRFGYQGRNCEQKVSMCVVSGDPHYTTFDGQVQHFQGDCKYFLVVQTDPFLPQFQILGKNERRHGNRDVSYLRYVELVVGQDVARLDRNKTVYVNNVQHHPYAKVGPFTVENNALFVRVVATLTHDVTGQQFDVVVESDGEWISLIKLPTVFKNNTTGMCGNFNDNAEDDLTTCDGRNVTGEPNKYSLIGNSCQVDDPSNLQCTGPLKDLPACSIEQVQKITNKCKNILGEVFAKCGDSVNLKAQYSSCNFDVCATGDAAAACRSLHSLAVQCAAKDRAVDWREKTGCPLACKEPLVYKAKTRACPATCGQLEAPSQCHLPDQESCVCPDDTPVLHKGKCVTQAECPCTAPDGTTVQVGAEYAPDCTAKYMCVLCDDCRRAELRNETNQCPDGQVCEQRDGVLDCFPTIPTLTCKPPLVYKAKASACPATCGELEAPSQCHLPDQESCVCPDDTPVLHEGKCVTQAECPCTAPDGTTVQVGAEYAPDCTAKYTCELCDDCSQAELRIETNQCPDGEVCEPRDGVLGCFPTDITDGILDCDYCDMVTSEVGYLPDLMDPSRYYQCRLRADYSWEVVRRQCSNCTVWHQGILACNWDDQHLLEDCNPEETPGATEEVHHYSNGSCGRGDMFARGTDGNVCQYEERVQGSWVARACPPGTAFNSTSCGCVMSGQCQSQVSPGSCLTFDKGWNNLEVSGGYQRYIAWSRDGVPMYQPFPTSPGIIDEAGLFIESDNLEIPEFSNVAWDQFQISFFFMQMNRSGEMQGLVSNGDCKSKPSLLIGLQDNGTLVVEVRPSGQNEAQTGNLVQLSSRVRVDMHAWHHVVVTYYQQTLALYVNSDFQTQASIKAKKDQAYIRHRCPLLIGAAAQGNSKSPSYFHGLIDELCLQLKLEPVLA